MAQPNLKYERLKDAVCKDPNLRAVKKMTWHISIGPKKIYSQTTKLFEGLSGTAFISNSTTQKIEALDISNL